MPRHNEDLIQMGIAMFKKACSGDVKAVVQPGKPTLWSGKQCAGGGAHIRHTMNEDEMTPTRVASELGLRSITRPANAAYTAEILKQSQRYLDGP